MNQTYDWPGYFDRFFEEVKRQFRDRHPFQDKSEISPKMAALSDAISNLPVPVDIIDVKVDISKHSHIKDEICQLMRFDFSKYGVRVVSYHGAVDSNRPEELSRWLTSFGFTDAQKLAPDFCSNLNIVGFGDTENPEVYFIFKTYDVRKNVETFVDDFLMMFWPPVLPAPIIERFLRKEMDFNALYKLTKDRTSTISENIEQAEKRAYPRATFEQLQEHIADIQLIPKVPEDVKRVFKRAKDLYVFGYFRYEFFTVSEHYAFLALESAIKHRYILSLGGTAVLTNRKGETAEISQPSYEGIWRFCKSNRKAWDARKIKVNDMRFPYNMQRLLDWLVNTNLIAKWERDLLDAGVYLRNSLSHLEMASITLPGPQVLRRVAYEINSLFHNLDTHEQ